MTRRNPSITCFTLQDIQEHKTRMRNGARNKRQAFQQELCMFQQTSQCLCQNATFCAFLLKNYSLFLPDMLTNSKIKISHHTFINALTTKMRNTVVYCRSLIALSFWPLTSVDDDEKSGFGVIVILLFK